MKIHYFLIVLSFFCRFELSHSKTTSEKSTPHVRCVRLTCKIQELAKNSKQPVKKNYEFFGMNAWEADRKFVEFCIDNNNCSSSGIWGAMKHCQQVDPKHRELVSWACRNGARTAMCEEIESADCHGEQKRPFIEYSVQE